MSPVYTYRCNECGALIEVVEHISQLGSKRYICDEKSCDGEMQRMISETQGKPVTYNYFSENLDAHITGIQQKRRVMKEKNLEEK